jgi:hypothetical protein
MLESSQVLSTPVTRYVQRITVYTEKKKTQHSIQQRELEILRSVVNKRTQRTSGKRNELKGEFCISKQDILERVEACEAVTRARRSKKTCQLRQRALTQTIDTSEDEIDTYSVSDDSLDELAM